MEKRIRAIEDLVEVYNDYVRQVGSWDLVKLEHSPINFFLFTLPMKSQLACVNDNEAVVDNRYNVHPDFLGALKCILSEDSILVIEIDKQTCIRYGETNSAKSRR